MRFILRNIHAPSLTKLLLSYPACHDDLRAVHDSFQRPAESGLPPPLRCLHLKFVPNILRDGVIALLLSLPHIEALHMIGRTMFSSTSRPSLNVDDVLAALYWPRPSDD